MPLCSGNVRPVPVRRRRPRLSAAGLCRASRELALRPRPRIFKHSILLPSGRNGVAAMWCEVARLHRWIRVLVPSQVSSCAHSAHPHHLLPARLDAVVHRTRTHGFSPEDDVGQGSTRLPYPYSASPASHVHPTCAACVPAYPFRRPRMMRIYDLRACSCPTRGLPFPWIDDEDGGGGSIDASTPSCAALCHERETTHNRRRFSNLIIARPLVELQHSGSAFDYWCRRARPRESLRGTPNRTAYGLRRLVRLPVVYAHRWRQTHAYCRTAPVHCAADHRASPRAPLRLTCSSTAQHRQSRLRPAALPSGGSHSTFAKAHSRRDAPRKTPTRAVGTTYVFAGTH
ncbi:hypothetical protein OH77DRAFT_1298695 [Trametes cingulata]|nr:hypothetical protein OH77DRAFT_1298695 [Trametes cingulata]